MTPLRCPLLFLLCGMLRRRQEKAGNGSHHKDLNPSLEIPHSVGG